MNRKEITLVGAGLAGCLAAVYLARRGFRVRIFEKRPDMRIHQIPAGRSINLSMSVRGIHALQEVGLYRRIERELIAMPGRMLHDQTERLQYQRYGRNPSDVHYSVSRGALNKMLLDAAEETGTVVIAFNQECVGLDPAARTITFRDQASGAVRSLKFDVVIGADGAGSAVGRALHERQLIQSRHEKLAHAYKELTIPATVSGEHRLEKNALHIWPRGGFMLIALPNTDGSFTATLFLPQTGAVSFETITSEADVRRFFENQFPDVLPLIPSLTADFTTHPTGELGTLRCKPWHAGGTVMLIGDAAHAIVPFHGQGMNCAFEDCSALNRYLDACQDWPSLFESLETSRRPNADAIADLALENYIEMRDSVRDPKFHLIKQIEWLLEERHPDRFIARYSMVMFHRIPYAEAQRRGLVQTEILKSLSADIDRIDHVDVETADRLVTEKLRPIGTMD
jgi:kynurenine 3-monooxygenase